MLGKRAASECAGIKEKKIKLEDGGYAIISKTSNTGQSKKSQSEPPSFKNMAAIAPKFEQKKGTGAGSSILWSPSRAQKKKSRRTPFSPSTSTSSRSNLTATPSHMASPTRSVVKRTNSLGRSLQNFNALRGASAPVLSSTASLQGSTPTVRYMGPPKQVVQVAQQQHPAPPSASGSGTNTGNRTSTNSSGDQAGQSILMKIEWASIDNPFLCGGHPILLQGKGTIPEMMNSIKSQVTKFENSLKKKLAKGGK